MRKTFVCALLGFIAAQAAFAEEAGKVLVDSLVTHWERTKTLSLAVAEAMPEEAYPFKPSAAQEGFDQQMGSLALSTVLSCTMALGTRAPERFQSAFDKPMDSSKAGILKSLTVAYDYCIDGLKAMNEADLFKLTAFKGRKEARFDIFWEGYARATYGLGNAEVYLRFKGITPPDTGPKYDF